MKVDRLDAHDRYTHFKKADHNIAACCQSLIDQKPFGDHPFYIFAHARTHDDDSTKRIIWQPRLTKPKAEPNSMLFKAYPGKSTIKIIWMIPDRDMWSCYEKGKLTESEICWKSIHMYKTDRKKLESAEEDDPSEHEINQIYTEIAKKARL